MLTVKTFDKFTAPSLQHLRLIKTCKVTFGIASRRVQPSCKYNGRPWLMCFTLTVTVVLNALWMWINCFMQHFTSCWRHAFSVCLCKYFVVTVHSFLSSSFYRPLEELHCKALKWNLCLLQSQPGSPAPPTPGLGSLLEGQALIYHCQWRSVSRDEFVGQSVTHSEITFCHLHTVHYITCSTLHWLHCLSIWFQ